MASTGEAARRGQLDYYEPGKAAAFTLQATVIRREAFAFNLWAANGASLRTRLLLGADDCILCSLGHSKSDDGFGRYLNLGAGGRVASESRLGLFLNQFADPWNSKLSDSLCLAIGD